MNIRKIIPSDRKYLREICKTTAVGYNKMSKNQLNAICSFYCDYYIECEPDNAFAATDENNVPIGYIFASSDRTIYKKEIGSYIGRSGGYSFANASIYASSVIFEKLILPNNTAHIHINIKDGYRRNGLGTQLLNTETENLKAKGIKTIHLLTGTDNIRARNFYEKNGFEIFTDIFGTAVYTKNI